MKKILALIITLFISVTVLSAGSIERLKRQIRHDMVYFPSAFVRIKSDQGTEILLDVNNPNLILYTSGIKNKNTTIICNNVYIEFVNMDMDQLIKILYDLSSSRINRVDNLNIHIIRS